VRLEVAFLDADQASASPAPSPAADDRACLTVLVVAAEVDLRRYVRECLRERTDLRLVEAATVSAAIALATGCSPDLLIVDDPERHVLSPLSQLRAIVIVDDVPRGPPALGTHVRFLVRPFTAERLVGELGELLGGATRAHPPR
jgi:hypothetical protein